ncbi:MAG: hypothetical protein ACTSWQ_08025, partial [Candidatus Thorarchaeota archaeon]
PADSRYAANACVRHAAMFRYNARTTRRILEGDERYFRRKLLNAQRELPALEPDKRIQPMTAICDGSELTRSVFGTLYCLKSYLDVFAGLLGDLVGPKKHITFAKATLKGVELAGGRLINHLRHSCPVSDETTALADHLERDSKAWITEAIGFRDSFTHRGGIPGFKPLRVDAAAFFADPDTTPLLHPELPDGRTIVDYCFELIPRLALFTHG